MSSFTINGNAVYLHICGRAICLPSQLMVMLYGCHHSYVNAVYLSSS